MTSDVLREVASIAEQVGMLSSDPSAVMLMQFADGLRRRADYLRDNGGASEVNECSSVADDGGKC